MKQKFQVIFLEGPRGVGKTTVARFLHDECNKRGILCVNRKFERTDNPWHDMQMQLSFIHKDIDKAVSTFDRDVLCVIDRFHLTEAVMRIADGTCNYKGMLANAKAIDLSLQHYGFQTFLLIAEGQVLHHRVEKRDDGRGHEITGTVDTWYGVMGLLTTGQRSSIKTVDAQLPVEKVAKNVFDSIVWQEAR